MTARPARLLEHLHRLLSRPAPAPETDAALLDRFVRQRDEAAFAALVARHGPMVRRLCRRLVADTHAADDAFQAAFLVLARRAAAVRPPQALAAWLHGVAYRVALHARTAEARRQRRLTPTPDLAPPDPHPDPLAALTARELLTVLDEEVQRLPEVYRLPVLLCGLEGRTQEEAARLLGWTPGSVKGRLERGRKRLHARLARRGLTPSAALASVEVARDLAPGQVPGPLAAATARLALTFGTDAGALGLSANVSSLVQGALRSSIPVRLAAGGALLLAVGVLALGAGLLTQPSGSGSGSRTGKPPAPAGGRPRIDPHDDPLPVRASARLGTLRFRHGGPVCSLAFAPKDPILASAGYDRLVRLWDATTGREIRRFAGHAQFVSAIAFSPDGRTLASSSVDNTVRVWEVASGRELHRLRANQGWMVSIAFSPDGKLLASGGGKTVRVWEVATGRPTLRLQGHQDMVLSVAFAPDGKTLASGGQDQAIRLWDTAAGKELRQFRGHQGLVSSVAFSPNGAVLASAGADRSIRLWEAATGKAIRQLRGHNDRVYHVAFSRDGRLLASASYDQTVCLWDAATGNRLRRLRGHSAAVYALAFSTDGKTLATGGVNDCTIHLWDAATGREVRPAEGPVRGVTSVACAPDGQTLAVASADGSIRLWQIATGKVSRRLPGHRQGVTSVAFSSDGKLLVSGGWDRAVRLWRVATGEELRNWTGQPLMIHAVAFSPENRLVAAGGQDGTVRLWQTATGQEVRRLEGHRQGVVSLTFSPDGRALASGSLDRTVRLWDLATGKESRVLCRSRRGAVQAVFSPDGKLLAVGGEEGTLRLWHLATGMEVLRLADPQGKILALCFSHDGRTLAAGGENGTIRLWDPGDGSTQGLLRGHRGAVRSVAFAAGERCLVSGSDDTTALVWKLPTRRHKNRPQPGRLGATELEGLWQDLLAEEGSRAYRAVGVLAGHAEQVVPWLRRHLQPVAPAEPKRLDRLIAELDSRQYAVRNQARRELEALARRALPALRQALQGQPSIEVRKRLEELLHKLEAEPPSPSERRELWAVEVLERLGTPGARRVLAALSRGAPEARQTRAARAALDRLARR
jgi:RNA polymerase sigma factor (sigma-70 family)